MIALRPHRAAQRLWVMARRTFIKSLFGVSSKTSEIIEKQNELAQVLPAQITILNKDNSPNTKHFDPDVDMPDFKIVQWKSTVVRARDIENTYTNESVIKAINEVYTQIYGQSLTEQQYDTALLSDLKLRFQFCKALQQKLGFDIFDYTISRSHNVGELYAALRKNIAARWSNERNPNAIVLRAEDFSQPNVYLNKELDEEGQKRYFEQLKKAAGVAE
ncbi:hypothetical protein METBISCDRAFT_20973 [Metschnikowia bicuspidata]|uniref:Large ribosomal subunit protein mL50 n=1 Tax=Metschnikowia bicuspidata TaxID=27322 RepID=A0A4P9ZI79_9ASCO|nr:hypothetical protein METBISCDRAFT_20973 [Metschnikowia bicuspidata]